MNVSIRSSVADAVGVPNADASSEVRLRRTHFTKYAAIALTGCCAICFLAGMRTIVSSLSKGDDPVVVRGASVSLAARTGTTTADVARSSAPIAVAAERTVADPPPAKTPMKVAEPAEARERVQAPPPARRAQKRGR